MAGIILVTKPPFLFPPENHYNSTALKNVLGDYLDRKFVLYDLRGKFLKNVFSIILLWNGFYVSFIEVNVTTTTFEDPNKGDLYFVGAIIALSSSIFSAANNIVVAKIVSYDTKTLRDSTGSSKMYTLRCMTL